MLRALTPRGWAALACGAVLGAAFWTALAVAVLNLLHRSLP